MNDRARAITRIVSSHRQRPTPRTNNTTSNEYESPDGRSDSRRRCDNFDPHFLYERLENARNVEFLAWKRTREEERRGDGGSRSPSTCALSLFQMKVPTNLVRDSDFPMSSR